MSDPAPSHDPSSARNGESGRSRWKAAIAVVVVIGLVSALPLIYGVWWAARSLWVPYAFGNDLDGLADDIGGLSEGGRNSQGDAECWFGDCFEMTVYYDSDRSVSDTCQAMIEVLGPTTPQKVATGDVCWWVVDRGGEHLTAAVTPSGEVWMKLRLDE